MRRNTLIYLISIWPRRAWISQLMRQLKPVIDSLNMIVLTVDNDDKVTCKKAYELPSFDIHDLSLFIKKFCTQKILSEKLIISISLDPNREGEVLEFKLQKEDNKGLVEKQMFQIVNIGYFNSFDFKAGICSQTSFNRYPFGERGFRYNNIQDYFEERSKILKNHC